MCVCVCVCVCVYMCVYICTWQGDHPSHTPLVVLQEHEWFKVDLPDYLIPSVQKEKVLKIDMTVVTEVCGRIGQ